MNRGRPPYPHVHQISVSDGGVPKRPVFEARVTAQGVAGDRQRNVKVHGGPDRAVCLYSLELIEALKQEGHPIAPGSSGENFTLAGLDWNLGDTVTGADLERVTSWMADALVAALSSPSPGPEVASLWLTDPLDFAAPGPVTMADVKGAMFSGGVAEYVYGREERDFGDLGRRLGHAIRARLDAGRFPFQIGRAHV